MKYQYAECDPVTNKANVHFYYDPTDDCDAPMIKDPKTGETTKDGSDPLPPYSSESCDHQCNKDGEFSHIQVYPYVEQVCKTCSPNAIAINGGFIIDAKMDDEDFLSSMVQKHFTIDCRIVH